MKAYEKGRCDALSTDVSQLVSYRSKMVNPDEHVVLPEVISKEPIGPWVRQGDDQWFDLVRWTLFAVINAEELGVTQENVSEMLKSQNPEIRRLLGQEGKLGEALGLANDWVARIVRHVGNYGEFIRPQSRQNWRAAGREQPMDQGRSAIRAADPVTLDDA